MIFPLFTDHDRNSSFFLLPPRSRRVVEKRGSRAGSTQRGCCRDLGEATEDDEFEVEARKRRLADSSSKKHQDGSGDKNGEGSEGEGNGTVTEQPGASPEMAATTTEAKNTTTTKPDTDEAK